MRKKSNIVLIGMPGAGKSTVGPLLAGHLEMAFLDTDPVVRDAVGMELRELVAVHGYEKFLERQEEVLSRLTPWNTVISTGGSVVCSPGLMSHLCADSMIVYLMLEFSEVERRLAPGRKLARGGGQSLRDTYDQRAPLYEKYADVVVSCTSRTPEEIAAEIISQWKGG